MVCQRRPSCCAALQGVIEKSVVMGLATNNHKASPSLSDLVTRYAATLAAQGRLSTAMEYLDMVGGRQGVLCTVHMTACAACCLLPWHASRKQQHIGAGRSAALCVDTHVPC